MISHAFRSVSRIVPGALAGDVGRKAMLESSVIGAAMQLAQAPVNQFFRVVGLGPARYSQLFGMHLVFVHDDDLPPEMKWGEDESKLLLFQFFEKTSRRDAARIIAHEIDYSEEIGLLQGVPSMPVDGEHLLNGAVLFVDNSEVLHGTFLRIGSVARDGSLYFSPRRRRGRGGRGRRSRNR